MKPADYHQRRTWQNEARARGEIPECGREACNRPADPAWLNHHMPPIYCAECAALINRHNPGFCYPESHAEMAMYVGPMYDPQRIERDTTGGAATYVISIDHGDATDTGVVTIYQDGVIVDVTSWRPRPADTTAATTNLPADPKLNRAQRRERDRQRWRARWAAGGSRG